MKVKCDMGIRAEATFQSYNEEQMRQHGRQDSISCSGLPEVTTSTKHHSMFVMVAETEPRGCRYRQDLLGLDLSLRPQIATQARTQSTCYSLLSMNPL